MNEIILTALEELNNIFFIESSSSGSKKNTLDDNVKSNSDNVLNLEEDFNKINLNNFEFVKNPDNYIKNKVYDELKLKVKEFFESEKCSYHFNCCFEQIGYEQFLTCQVEFESLDKKM